MLAASHHQHQPSAAVRHHSAVPQSLDYDIWAEMLIKSNRNSFGRPDSEQNFGPWARRPQPQITAAGGGGSKDESKPPPPTISRAQMIERYRHEMMELVRNMPEEEGEEVAAYELSLRDMVERPPAKKAEVETAEDSVEMKMKRMAVSRGKNKRVTGLLMKEFMPRVMAVLGVRKAIAGAGGGKGAKVSPKPSNGDCEEKSCSTGSSDSSDIRNRSGLGSCYLFLQRHRSKSMEI